MHPEENTPNKTQHKTTLKTCKTKENAPNHQCKLLVVECDQIWLKLKAARKLFSVNLG